MTNEELLSQKVIEVGVWVLLTYFFASRGKIKRRGKREEGTSYLQDLIAIGMRDECQRKNLAATVPTNV